MKNNPDAIYVSIHLNKFTTSAASGAQVFYTKNYDEARLLAESVQSKIIELIQPENTRVVEQGTSRHICLKTLLSPRLLLSRFFKQSFRT